MQKKNRKSIKNKKYKGGNINKDSNYLTIITPCIKQENLDTIKNSIDFTKNLLWIIIYDTTNKKFEHKYNNVPKIVEYDYSDTTGTSGNPQRNFGLDKVKNGFIYFLDDDNIIHPKFWEILPAFVNTYIYTFDQQNGTNNNIRLVGHNVEIGKIDTAQFVVPYEMINDLRWNKEDYKADGIFITELYKKYPNNFKYINGVYCYYNYLKK